MEFQADLVSVSVTGSDALSNALHKLSGADDALDRAVNFAAGEHDNKRPVKDVFATQTRVLDHLRSIYDDPHYGAAPAPSEEAPERRRVFKSEVAAPPRMWATHPENADREDNAKAVFVHCAQDERSAWELFPDAQALREKMTAQLFAPPKTAKGEALAPEASPATAEETFARLEDAYSIKTIDRRYRGAYLSQSATRNFTTVADMYGDAPAGEITARIDALYPPEFGDSLEKLRKLFDEKATFEGVQKGYLKAPGGVIRWRGEEMAPRHLPRVLKALDEEISPIKSDIANHLRETRSAHLAAARALGQGWDAYLTGLASLLHYAEHTHADLMDLHGVLANVFAVVTADRKVTRDELNRLIDAGNDLYSALHPIYRRAGEVVLDERTAARAAIEDFKQTLGEFTLPRPNETNMGEWLKVIDGWVGGAAGALKAVHSSALQELLIAEDEIAGWHKAGAPAPTAPAAARAPSEYPRLLFGENRPRQEKLGWWDRFQVADGWLAASARTLVAGSVVGAVIVLGAGLAFRGSVNTAAFQPSAPMPHEQSGLATQPEGPSSPDLAPFETTPDAAIPGEESEAVIPQAASNGAPWTSSAPAVSPTDSLDIAAAAPSSGAQSAEVAPSEASIT